MVNLHVLKDQRDGRRYATVDEIPAAGLEFNLQVIEQELNRRQPYTLAHLEAQESNTVDVDYLLDLKNQWSKALSRQQPQHIT